MGAAAGYLRMLRRHPLYAALTIGGLALGIATFLVLALFVRWERGWDRWRPGADRLWVVQQTFHVPGAPADPISMTMPSLLSHLRDGFGVDGVRIAPTGATVLQRGAATREMLWAADPDYFVTVGSRFLAGDPHTALARPDGVVVARSVAERYFAPGRAMGGMLTLSINGGTWRYRVTGVVADPPGDTSLSTSMVVPLEPRVHLSTSDNWAAPQVFTVLRLPDQAAADALERRLPQLVARHGAALGPRATTVLTLALQPLTALHLQRPDDRTVVSVLGLIGVLALALAVGNYVNLATAQAGLRAREVAMRKTVGATRGALVRQFLAEAVATTALAMLAALALAELALPFVNSVSGASLRIAYQATGSILPTAIVLVIGLGLIAGAVPAALLSSIWTTGVLAATRSPGGGPTGARLRQALVLGQFAIATVLAVGTAVLALQAYHVQRSDLGFRRDGLIVVQSFSDPALTPDRRDRMRAALGGVHGVASVTAADDAPAFRIAQSLGEIARPGTVGPFPAAHLVSIGPRFFETYGVRLLAGRLPDDRHGADAVPSDDPAVMASREHDVAVSRRTAAVLGFRDPVHAIGKAFQLSHAAPLRIIGVVDDMRFGSPREPLDALIFYYHPAGAGIQIAAMRYAGVDAASVLAGAAAAWRRVAPDVPFDARPAQAQLYDYYRADAQRARLFTIGAALAIAIACLGLYGLAAFDTVRRVREIWIRKALGASTGEVLRLLVGRFVRPVLAANLLAWPIAFVAMRRWLATFDDRIALSPGLFILPSLAALLLAVLTVLGQSWRVARASPALALRYE